VVVVANIDDAEANTAYFLDARTGGWFPMTWPTAIGPDCIVSYDADDPNDKALLLGSRDGWIYKVDATEDDDGTAISSNVRFFPVGTRRGTDSRLHGLELNLAESSGDVTVKLYTGQTAEQCATSTEVRWARTCTAGVNRLTLPRLAGAWLQIEITSTARWALESLYGLYTEGGRSRSRKRG
jgi:hypothetical protein